MEGFLGEIRAFAGSYAPVNWHLCDGSSLPIPGNEALYSLIGNTYGTASAPNSFLLPNLCGRLPVSQGQGAGLSNYVLGQSGGQESVVVTAAQMPTHNHMVQVSTSANTTTIPTPATFLGSMYSPGGRVVGYLPGSDIKSPVTLDSSTVVATGLSQPHANVMPCCAISYIICLVGLYPSPD